MNQNNIITSFSKRRSSKQALLLGFIIISLFLLTSCTPTTQSIVKDNDMNQPQNPSVGNGCGVTSQIPIENSNQNYEEAPEGF